jgi:hypothetical protein
LVSVIAGGTLSTTRFRSTWTGGNASLQGGTAIWATGANAGITSTLNNNTGPDVILNVALGSIPQIGDTIYLLPSSATMTTDGLHPGSSGGTFGGKNAIIDATKNWLNARLLYSVPPSPFVAANWTLTGAGTTQASINILSLPFNGGNSITKLYYKIQGGDWQLLPNIITGSYVIGGFTDGVSTTVNIIAANNIGQSFISDTKNITTSA